MLRRLVRKFLIGDVAGLLGGFRSSSHIHDPVKIKR